MEYLGKRKDMVSQTKRHSRRIRLIFFYPVVVATIDANYDVV
jgi:hypothetical protein